MSPKLNTVPFVSVDHMMKLVLTIGIERFLQELTSHLEQDFRRWEMFDKTPRVASHSHEGVIELMPASDGQHYGFKYVNGHPKNNLTGRQTVTAFGVLAEVGNGYPVLLSEMTLLTALRTAATSAMAAKYLAPPGAATMAIIGNGAQSEFQAMAFAQNWAFGACGSMTSTPPQPANAPPTSCGSVLTSFPAGPPKRPCRAPTSSPP
jgi:ornithine cyclodeaminase